MCLSPMERDAEHVCSIGGGVDIRERKPVFLLPLLTLTETMRGSCAANSQIISWSSRGRRLKRGKF